MFIQHINSYRCSVTGTPSGSVVIKDDTATITIELNETELAMLESIAVSAHQRKQADLAAKMAQPLETNLLAPPTPAPTSIEDADFDEVSF